ncbi:hypothetical protein QTP88_011815 [Uroleucon formosanum]
MLSQPREVRTHSSFSRSIINDIDITDTNKNYARTEKTNKVGKSVQITTNKEKVITVKSVDTGLPNTRKMRALKKPIKTFVKGKTPLKNSNTQQHTVIKKKLNEVQKHIQSTTKEVVTTKSRVSVLNYLTDKDEKATSNDLIPSPVDIKVVLFDNDLPIVGNNFGVNYGDEQITIYDVKFINECDIERAMKYYLQYKGWNSRYDVVSIASKTKDLEPEPEVNNDTDSSKFSPPEQKKVPPTTSRTRRMRTSSAVINSFSGARQAVKSVSFDSNVLGKSSLFVPSISSSSSKDLYNHNTPSIGKCGFYENSMPSTIKSFYYPESDVNSVLSCEETIPGSPTSASEEQNNEEERKKALQEIYGEREVDSTILCFMNHPFHKPNTLMDDTKEKKIEEYITILEKDGAIYKMSSLQILAEVSLMNPVHINEEKEPEHDFKKMSTSQHVAVISEMMNKLRSRYNNIQKKLAKVLKNKKKIQKKKKENAKATSTI